jgi:hypothetical protein
MSEITDEIQNFKYNKHSSQGKAERIAWIKEKLKPYTFDNEVTKTNVTVINNKIRYYLKWLQFSPNTRRDYEDQILFELKLIE